VHNYLLLYVIAAVAIFAFLQGVFLFIDASGDIAARTERRLNSLSINDPTEVLRRKALGEGASPWLATLLASSPVRWLDRLIIASGINKTTERVLVVMTFGLSVAVMLLKFVGGLGLLTSLSGSFVLAVMLPVAQATPAVLLYRLVTYWLVMLPGWISFKVMEKRGEV